MQRKTVVLAEVKGFEWDEGNIDENWKKHKVTNKEAEEVFINKPLLIVEDKKHSWSEKRFQALGRTSKNRWLFIAFTIREGKIRVISARDQSRNERRIYEKEIEAYSRI